MTSKRNHVSQRKINPRSTKLNVSINEAAQKWEPRFIEIKEYVDSLATHDVPIDPGVYARLSPPLPILKIEPSEERQTMKTKTLIVI